jgi:nicotinate phosphoribosyltransferase
MGLVRTRPSREILSGDSADVYFARAESILAREGMDPVVTMEVFARQDAVLCGIDEAKNLIGHVLAESDPAETRTEALDDGDRIAPKEVVLRIHARYRRFGLYETAILGMLAQSTGWATAARECVDVASPAPVISFGARHVHPDITDVLDYASIVGGCVGASTPAGARLAGLAPTGTMPHALVLIFGDTVEAALAFDRDLGPEVARIVLVDTFKDEAEGRSRVAHALGDRLYGIRLDTPSAQGPGHRGPRQGDSGAYGWEGYDHVRSWSRAVSTRSGSPTSTSRARPVDSFAVGSPSAARRRSTSPATSRDRRPADRKRGRIPGTTPSPRLRPVDLGLWRDGPS